MTHARSTQSAMPTQDMGRTAGKLDDRLFVGLSYSGNTRIVSSTNHPAQTASFAAESKPNRFASQPACVLAGTA